MTSHDLRFTNRFAELPDRFYQRVHPTPVPDPVLVAFNPDAAALLDLDPAAAHDPDCLAWVAGNRVPPGADPLAMAYAGHQFGVFVPQLGDGRAILLGGVTNRRGEHWEVQLKGSGQTRYSRFGDGRAVLRSTIREYLCSEAMAGLGIPTSRALAIASSDLPVQREEFETAAVLVRLAPSHVRFGSFEFFAARKQDDAVRELADWVIGHYHPALAGRAERHAEWFEEITVRTARLIAGWMAVGWAHGVMNTDNMSILGLT
ncbi:MAG: YdiU family protein, partial [Gemmatimonadales bacterium]|nr:YdiU family protein [Gemmatimonadales bacterium]